MLMLPCAFEFECGYAHVMLPHGLTLNSDPSNSNLIPHPPHLPRSYWLGHAYTKHTPLDAEYGDLDSTAPGKAVTCEAH